MGILSVRGAWPGFYYSARSRFDGQGIERSTAGQRDGRAEGVGIALLELGVDFFSQHRELTTD